MSVFVGHIVRTIDTAEGREAIVGVRGARRVVILDAVPHARRGDAVLVEAGVALAIVRDEGLPAPVGPKHAGRDVRHATARGVERRSSGQADTPCV